MKGFFKRLFTDLKILVLALIIAIVAFVVVKNPELFQASVLQVQDRETMQANQRDIGYKTTSGVLDVFIAENIKNFTEITFQITLDPQNITPDFTKIESQMPYEIIDQSENGFDIRLTSATLSGLDYNQSLFMIPFSGNNTHILLSEGIITFNNGDMPALAIGNLNEGKTTHQN
jgi:hypothetical protein